MYLEHVVALAGSVHSVGIVSELTALETVPPLEIPPAQLAIGEPQPDPGHTVGQPVNVQYLPQCKYYLPIVKISLKSLHRSSLFHPVADFSPFGISDHFPWYASLGSITFGWYDRYRRDMLRDSIQQYSECKVSRFFLRHRPDIAL